MYRTAEKVKKSADDLMKTLGGKNSKEMSKEAKELKKSPEGQQLKQIAKMPGGKKMLKDEAKNMKE